MAIGTKIAEIGDPADIEVTVDLLSSDAVRVAAGSRAEIFDWGGDRPLSATVRRIDPAGFTKVSALGIEEQRVNLVLDLDDVVIRGMTDPSAMRSRSMPYTLSLLSTTDIASRPIFAEHVWCQ